MASKEEALREFMEAYERTGEIRAQWLVLSSELLSDQTKAAAFYRGLRDDPRIHWLAGFTGRQGRGLWIGEIGVPTARGPIPAYDVEPMAREYERKYDRYSFLKRNARYVMHD